MASTVYSNRKHKSETMRQNWPNMSDQTVVVPVVVV